MLISFSLYNNNTLPYMNDPIRIHMNIISGHRNRYINSCIQFMPTVAFEIKALTDITGGSIVSECRLRKWSRTGTSDRFI